MELFGQIEAQVITERGSRIPLFIFTTEHFDEALQALKVWYLSPLVLDVPFLQSLPITLQGIPKNAGYRRLEWSFEDWAPDSAYEMYLTRELTDKLATANREARTFAAVLENKAGMWGRKRSQKIPDEYYSPYLLDWTGLTGVLFYIRNDVSSEKVQNIARDVVPMVCKNLESGGIAEATGLYTELGYQFRMIEEWEQAIHYYRKEIEFSLKQKPRLGRGCMKALCNLGVIYKKQAKYDLATRCFILALYLNPNYFEVLVSLAGIIDHLDVALLCLARGARIRPGNPYVGMAVENICQGLELDLEPTLDRLNQMLPQVDFVQPIPQLTIKDPVPYLRDLGFRCG